MDNLPRKNQIFIYSCVLLAFIALHIYLLQRDIPIALAFPATLLSVIIFSRDIRILFYSLFAFLPFSFDISFGSLSLSAPSEPVMILLSLALILLSLGRRYNWAILQQNTLVILIALQFVLFIINIGFSTAPILSFKYLLAKIWFIAAFVFMSIYILNKNRALKTAVYILVIATLITILYTIARHAATGFGFEEVNAACRPFYLNHVNYASFIAMVFPFLVSIFFWKDIPSNLRYIILGCIGIFLFAIITSYTRTTWLAVIVGFLAVIIFRLKMLKPALIVGTLCIALAVTYILQDNRYIEFAPDYKTTVFNREDFSKHMEATVELSDVSGMERIYRWVAALNMIKENFWLGTGNNTFYPLYKDYVNPAFVTYVSHNPERSTTHNYFLLLFCDQGVFGFLLFTLFFYAALLRAHTLYHKTRDSFYKSTLMATFACLIILLVHLMLGDMIEIDKTGGLFYLCIGIIISIDLRMAKESQDSNQSPSVEEKILKE